MIDELKLNKWRIQQNKLSSNNKILFYNKDLLFLSQVKGIVDQFKMKPVHILTGNRLHE